MDVLQPRRIAAPKIGQKQLPPVQPEPEMPPSNAVQISGKTHLAAHIGNGKGNAAKLHQPSGPDAVQALEIALPPGNLPEAAPARSGV